jgi:hypothetical protein
MQLPALDTPKISRQRNNARLNVTEKSISEI